VSRGPKFAVQRYKKINKKYKDRKWQFFVASIIRVLKRARNCQIRKEEFDKKWGKYVK